MAFQFMGYGGKDMFSMCVDGLVCNVNIVLKCMKNKVTVKFSCSEAKSVKILAYCVSMNVYIFGRCM